MEHEKITLDNLNNLHLIFRKFRSHDGLGYWFRGQADSAWELLPKAGRDDYYLPQNKDLGRFGVWKKQAKAYGTLPQDEFEQLAIAQHHGLATRLLDWSMNPLVACYFACAEHTEKDGSVFIYEVAEMVFVENYSLEILKNKSGVFAYIPHSISPRVLNQKALFSVHCDARHKLIVKESIIRKSHPNLVELVIPNGLKEDILKLLDDYGIDRAVLFPDLDGLSEHINRRTLRIKNVA